MEIESSESLLSFDDDSEEYIESQNEIIQNKNQAMHEDNSDEEKRLNHLA